MTEPSPLACLLIADDLTGACDAAAPFAIRGYRTVARLDSTGAMPEACASPEVLAISTESRSLPPGELRGVFAEAGRRLPAARVLFKKIDSTLRGNAGVEIALAAQAFGCHRALVTPAFPAMNRIVESGFLRVSGAAFEPIELAGYWRRQGIAECAHVPAAGVPAALDAGCRFVSADARCDADLDAIAAAGLARPERILFAGSAGLASALVRALPEIASPELPPAPQPAAALFCIGSDHAVTLEQWRRLLAERPAVALDAETADPAAIAEALRCRMHVALRIPYGRIPADRLLHLIGGVRAPLVLSGGDTASLVWRALGVRETRLYGEIAPGIARGVLRGGVFDGAPAVTKSGGFGQPDALIQIADHFLCLNR